MLTLHFSNFYVCPWIWTEDTKSFHCIESNTDCTQKLTLHEIAAKYYQNRAIWKHLIKTVQKAEEEQTHWRAYQIHITASYVGDEDLIFRRDEVDEYATDDVAAFGCNVFRISDCASYLDIFAYETGRDNGSLFSRHVRDDEKWNIFDHESAYTWATLV